MATNTKRDEINTQIFTTEIVENIINKENKGFQLKRNEKIWLKNISGVRKPSIKFAIEPVAKDKDHEELPFVFMDKILLVDDICDTGKSIEKIYKFLKLVNSNVEIDILCIYGNKGAEEYLGKYLPEAKLNYLYDNEDRWVTFGTWENDYNICKACIFGEACNRDPENMIHCSLHDKSFHWTHSCADFSLIKTHDIKFMGAGTLG